MLYTIVHVLMSTMTVLVMEMKDLVEVNTVRWCAYVIRTSVDRLAEDIKVQ